MSKKLEKVIHNEVKKQLLLKELFDQTFNFWLESGSFPTKPYNYPLDEKLTYRFDTSNFKYEVEIEYKVFEKWEDSYIELDFGTKETGKRELTNEGVPSNVFATVVEIIKEVLKRLPRIKKIESGASKKGDEESRLPFYKGAIKKLFPNAKISVKRNYWEVVFFDIILPKDYKERILS